MRRRLGTSLEWRLAVISVLLSMSTGVLAYLLAGSGWPWELRVGALLGAAAVVAATAHTIYRATGKPLSSLANVAGAIAQGDFSVRSAYASRSGALGELGSQVNGLGRAFRAQRVGALEASALVQKVIDEVDVAVLAFDHQDRLRLANRVGARILGRPAVHLLGRSARSLGVADLLVDPTPRLLERSFAGGKTVWQLRRARFRQRGLPHSLVVLTDLGHVLRDEERQAWLRLVRVLGHEINNSLGPIKSITETLLGSLAGPPRTAPEWEDDLKRGLQVIGRRAESLGRFMEAYARLARVPAPRLEPLDVGEWVHRTVSMETRMRVNVVPGPPVTVRADADQVDQLLINLVRNAVDAALETGGGVTLYWERNPSYAEVVIEDEGPGIIDAGNLFVPFFTTKSNGSGIGLALSRQIAEAHGGYLTLRNRAGGRGCEARVWLPRERPSSIPDAPRGDG